MECGILIKVRKEIMLKVLLSNGVITSASKYTPTPSAVVHTLQHAPQI